MASWLGESWRPNNGSRARKNLCILCRFLKFHLQELWITEEWEIGIAKGLWQTTTVDCGVCVCANAWRLVFGHDHVRDEAAWDASTMRKRMAAEILNGGLLIDDAVVVGADMCYGLHDEAGWLEVKALKRTSLKDLRRWLSQIRGKLSLSRWLRNFGESRKCLISYKVSSAAH